MVIARSPTTGSMMDTNVPAGRTGARNQDPSLIDLGIGEPDDTLLPLAALRHAAIERLSTPDTSCLQYGPEEGSASLRARLAEFLTRQYGILVGPEELLITAGASHGLDLILSRRAQPGDTILVEDPTYFLALDVLRDRHARVAPVPVDSDGLDVDALERQVQAQRPALLYTIPVFHNPTGAVLSDTRRRKLVALARELGFPIVADEVYHLVGEPDATPAPLFSLDRECVLTLGSFSKILAPGLRLGWIQAAPQQLAWLRDAGVLRSGGGVSPFTAAIVETAIALGLLDECLTSLRAMYNRRRRHLIESLQRVLPDGARFIPPQGGFYIWLELPARVDTTMLAAEATALGVNFRPGGMFSPEGRFGHCLRLCFSFYDEEMLTLASERFGKLLHARL